MSEKSFFDSYALGDLKLKNRIVLASLTRGRCDPKTGIPNDLLVKYYEQRASAGLIITEASPISAQGNSHPGAGCIYNKDHVAGWKKVTDAVHKKGSKIFIQLWHGGRACDSKKTGLPIVGPSALPIKNYNDKGEIVESETPKELTKEEIKGIVGEFVNAAKLAKEAGFDGVEIHGANGYIVDQFIRSESNKRTDEYGGSVGNRARFFLEIVDAISKVWPSNRIGVKLSPVGRYNYMFDEDPVETFSHILKELSKRNFGYVQVTEAGWSMGKSFFKDGKEQVLDSAKTFKKYFNGTFIANEGYNAETGLAVIQAGNADLVAFGKAFITNPDLPLRIKLGLELNNNLDWATALFGGEKGYTDYPFHEKNTVFEEDGKDDGKSNCCNIF